VGLNVVKINIITSHPCANVDELALFFNLCAPLVKNLLSSVLLPLLLLGRKHLLPFQPFCRLPPQVCCSPISRFPLILLQLCHRHSRVLGRRPALFALLAQRFGLALCQYPFPLEPDTRRIRWSK